VRSREMHSRPNFFDEMWILDPRDAAAATAQEIVKLVHADTPEMHAMDSLRGLISVRESDLVIRPGGALSI
jgi:hypothetical protein